MRPLSGLPLLLACLALAGAGSAVAAGENVLWRCQDGNGNLAFTNTRAGYSGCTEVGRYPAARATPAAPAARVQALSPQPAPPPEAAGATISASPGRRASRQQGAVYRYQRDGVVHYTNVRPAGGAEVLFTYAIEACIACQVGSTLDWHSVALRLTEYGQEIARATALHGVDEALVRAVIHAESAFRSNALSHAGAQGLMQLMPATAARFGVGDVYDPGQNIAGGVEYLAWLLRRFDGDIRLATAGYNAGEGAVDRHGGIPPFAETRVYVERVGILHERYRAALAATAAAAPVGVGASP